jgi:hypothetical protein
MQAKIKFSNFQLENSDLVKGEHQVTFEAKGLPANVYFYQLQADGKVETMKMIVSK